MRLLHSLLLSAALVAAAPLAAQAPAASGVTIIHAGALLDRPGKAPRGNATIIVQDGRIVSVQDGFAAVPAGATLVDLKQSFVLPGLIDSHVHLGSDRAGIEGTLASVTDSPQTNAYEALWNGQKTLDAGFTTVRNLGDDGATLALRDAIARGWVSGPRIVDAASSISTTSGHMDGRLGMREELHDDIPHEQSLRRRRRLPQGGAPPDRPRRRRDQDRHHRRRQQPDRRGPGQADVRRRGQGDRRHRPSLRQEGRGPRPRRRRHRGRAPRGRGLDRARHFDRRREPRLVQEERRLLRADPVDRERLSRADRRQSRTLIRPRSARRSTGGSASPARRSSGPSLPASRSRSAPTPACRSTAATPTSSN